MKLRALLLLFVMIAGQAFAGYDVHITKRKTWSDQTGPAISLKEWKDLVSTDPGMRMDGFAETVTDKGEKVRIESEGLAVWLNYSKHGENGNMAWFYWHDGEVMVKNPDPEIRRKMFRLAQKLKAKVQGDEGEFYDRNGNQIP